MAGTPPVADSDFWIDIKKGESPLRQWDKLTLGATTLPGLWLLEASSDYSFDVAKVNTNLSGPTPQYKTFLTNRGYNGGKLTATGIIWEQSDWKLLKKLLPEIWPKKKTTSTSFELWEISHPAAALIGISTVAIVGVSPLPITGQTLPFRISMVEWFEKQPILTRHGSGGPGITNDAPLPNPTENLK